MIAIATTSAPEMNCHKPEKEKKSVGVTTAQTASTKFLTMLTSMHIRQLVCPSYKYENVKAKDRIPTNVAHKIFVIPKTLNSLMVSEIENVKTKESDMGLVKKSAVKKKKGSRDVKQTKSGLVSKRSPVKLKKNNKIQEIITRVSTPTLSSLRKALDTGKI